MLSTLRRDQNSLWGAEGGRSGFCQLLLCWTWTLAGRATAPTCFCFSLVGQGSGEAQFTITGHFHQEHHPKPSLWASPGPWFLIFLSAFHAHFLLYLICTDPSLQVMCLPCFFVNPPIAPPVMLLLKELATSHRLDEEDYAYNTASQSMLNHSWKTSINLCALIQIPGVWDPFVKSYVEMLDFYGDRDGAREVLTNYAYDDKFPSNPNAHVYLYNFLKKEKAPREKLISVLKILYQIVPSHKLMFEFYRLLRKSEKEEDQKLGLEVLFGVLDFAGCTRNITAWKYLAKHLRQTLAGNRLAWIQELWDSRKNWWPNFHFSFFWAKSDWKEEKTLACEKALVAGILLGKGCRYFRYISKQDHQVLKKKMKRMKKSVKKFSIVKP
ncbi:TATA box-binding protein-associated factor RNA polymerase I subunit A isoform X4 [Erinaceus europaeus]|uniref:TATA box-binding protein-associated factor RNA polymerase I subunit A isoform X4 n=1 Tax=Erinaceus europaeus TaxID=9365 RepID=A0ABM3WD03_ERIEU|nr:TATA box-binding protein-associated factor RNA polymerase I subunit A isoform X4 [Erinaceus europaeus]